MTLIENLLSETKYGRKELARQELITNTTEQIWEALEAANMNKAELARALETSKANVTQLLTGNRNMTLSTLADIGEAVGVKPRIVFTHPNTLIHHDYWHNFSVAVAALSASEQQSSMVQTKGAPGIVERRKTIQSPIASVGEKSIPVLTLE